MFALSNKCKICSYKPKENSEYVSRVRIWPFRCILEVAQWWAVNGHGKAGWSPVPPPFGGGRTLYHLKKACLVERIGQLPHRATTTSSSCLRHLVPSLCTESDGKERSTTWYVEWLQDVQLIVPNRKSARVRQWGGAVGGGELWSGMLTGGELAQGGIVKWAGSEEETKVSQFSYLAAK